MRDTWEEERSERERERQLRMLAAAQRRDDLREVMALPAGRRLMWLLIHQDSGLRSRSHSGEQTHETAYLEGRRALGIQLDEELLRDASATYLLMMQERLESLPTDRLVPEEPEFDGD